MTKEQAAKIVLYQDEMSSILGIEVFNTLKEESAFQSSNSELIRTIAIDMSLNPENWNGLGYLNSVKREHWDSSLYCNLPRFPLSNESLQQLLIVINRNFIKENATV